MPPQSSRKEARKEERNQRAFGVLFNKQLGQHILKNPLVVQTIVERVSCSLYLIIFITYDN
jgi:hypothetical protein